MSKFIRTYGGGGNAPTKNLCLFSDVDIDVDIDIDIDFDIDVDIDDDDDDDIKNNNFNKLLEPVKLIDDSYYFNNSTGNKYKFKIEPTDKVWKLNDFLKQKMDYFHKTSRNFEKLGGSSTNIFYLDSNDISYFLHYYYMYAILDTLRNDKLSKYMCSVINSLYEFIKINTYAFVLNKKIKLFLNLFENV